MLKYLKTKKIAKKKTKYKKVKYTILGIIWAVIVPILVYLIQIVPVLNSRWLYLALYNGLIVYFIFPVLSLIILTGGPTGLVIFIVSFIQKLQRMTLRWVGIVLLINFIGCYGAGKLAQQMRNEKLLTAANNAQSVITALATYRAEQGKYPNSMLDLIPKYLEQIPVTELIGYPALEYEKVDSVSGMMQQPAADDTKNKWIRFETGGYELRMITPLSGHSFDRFVYWPKKYYPIYMYSGLTERIGDWAYVHE
ncbi:MAG: hypothetical protein QME64_01450 [bacterium]|nr:hypothetical protein [bacterium]